MVVSFIPAVVSASRCPPQNVIRYTFAANRPDAHMPWIPLYADDADFGLIHKWINDEPDLAFIVSDGPGRWRAVARLTELTGRRICLWHVPSGPLPLLHPHPSDTVDPITDPWSGWQELRAEGHGGRHPYFGAGHPGIFWLNHRPTRLTNPEVIGLSSFEWIGNHYRIIGRPAEASTEKYWKRLRTWISKQSIKLPRSGPLQGRGEIFTLPSAAARIQSGSARDSNPSA